ncbi:MAG: DUF2834 domain-containing protein [Burkholderiaceae bacterium]|nr:DUF2834 domain-containing protein [Burkholderiaceae bacterium]
MTLATWYFNIAYFAGGGSVAPSVFFQSAFANPLTTSITLDVYLAGLVFSVWVFAAAKRVGIKWPALYILLCFFVALTVAFPIFLAVRERILTRA